MSEKERERERGGSHLRSLQLIVLNVLVYYSLALTHSISLHVYLTDFEFVQLYLRSVGVDNNVRL